MGELVDRIREQTRTVQGKCVIDEKQKEGTCDFPQDSGPVRSYEIPTTTHYLIIYKEDTFCKIKGIQYKIIISNTWRILQLRIRNLK